MCLQHLDNRPLDVPFIILSRLMQVTIGFTPAYLDVEAEDDGILKQKARRHNGFDFFLHVSETLVE